MTSTNTLFFKVIFRNRYRADTGARFLEGLYTKKVRKNIFSGGCVDTTFFAVSGCRL